MLYCAASTMKARHRRTSSSDGINYHVFYKVGYGLTWWEMDFAGSTWPNHSTIQRKSVKGNGQVLSCAVILRPHSGLMMMMVIMMMINVFSYIICINEGIYIKKKKNMKVFIFIYVFKKKWGVWYERKKWEWSRKWNLRGYDRCRTTSASPT